MISWLLALLASSQVPYELLALVFVDNLKLILSCLRTSFENYFYNGYLTPNRKTGKVVRIWLYNSAGLLKNMTFLDILVKWQLISDLTEHEENMADLFWLFFYYSTESWRINVTIHNQWITTNSKLETIVIMHFYIQKI